MQIETMGLGAGSYPEPKEEMTKIIEVTIRVEYKTAIEVPVKWNDEQIKEDIKDNIVDYVNSGIIGNWEVEIDG